MKEFDASAAILAGGTSTRMGTNKGLMPIRGRPLILAAADALRGRFGELFIVSDDAAAFAFTGLPVIPDRAPGKGPLEGIASALEAARLDTLFVVACDMPEIDFALMERLLAAPPEYDCAVPRVGPGLYEPLFAVYRKSALPAMNAALAAGRRNVQAVFPLLKTLYVDADRPSGILNLNTPREVERYLAGS